MLPRDNLCGLWRPDEGWGLPLRLDRDDLAHGRLDRDDLALGRSDGRRYLDFSLLELQLPLHLRTRAEEVRDRPAVQGTRVENGSVAVDAHERPAQFDLAQQRRVVLDSADDRAVAFEDLCATNS